MKIKYWIFGIFLFLPIISSHSKVIKRDLSKSIVRGPASESNFFESISKIQKSGNLISVSGILQGKEQTRWTSAKCEKMAMLALLKKDTLQFGIKNWKPGVSSDDNSTVQQIKDIKKFVISLDKLVQLAIRRYSGLSAKVYLRKNSENKYYANLIVLKHTGTNSNGEYRPHAYHLRLMSSYDLPKVERHIVNKKSGDLTNIDNRFKFIATISSFLGKDFEIGDFFPGTDCELKSK